MNRFLTTALVATTLVVGSMANAGPIRNACEASPRARGDSGLCRCIQAAADATHSRSDQRRAARFFRDPDQSQQVRMSKAASDNAFWTRYRSFGDLAEARCVR